jgi:hypothetical protein
VPKLSDRNRGIEVKKRDLERGLTEMMAGSKESYRLHLEAVAAGYSIQLVKVKTPASHRAAAKRDLANLAGAR